MDKKIISTTKAPAPIGPYSQAVICNSTLYVSGQIAFVPATNELISGDVGLETHQVMRNLMEILNEAGLSFKNVVKTSIFLSDMAHFSKVNEIYGSYFSGDYPARETIAVKELPKSVNVEISMIASL